MQEIDSADTPARTDRHIDRQTERSLEHEHVRSFASKWLSLEQALQSENVSSRLKENVVNTSGSLPGNGSFQHKEGKGSCDLHATSHLHFRQNDLDLLRATAVT